MAQLDPAYSGSRNLYQQQIAALPGQAQSQVAALDAAKTNSFRDINTGANSKGLAFSGIPIAEQSRYLGEKYLPAVAGVQQSQNQQQMTLQQALAQLEQDRYKTALGTQQGQQKSLQDYLSQQEDYNFRAQQGALDRSAAASSKANAQTNIDIKKNAQGGWDVFENGQKSTNYDLATAAAATGKDLLSLLKQGDAQDKQAAKYYEDNVSQAKRTGGGDPDIARAYALKQLQKDRATAFYLGGTYGG